MVVRRGTVLVLLAVLAAGCAGSGPEPGASPAPGGAVPTAGATAAPPREPDPPQAGPSTGPAEPEPDTQVAVPVFYVARTAAGPRLQREFRRVPAGDPPSEAVRTMLASPTGTDPDYRSPWPPGAALRSPVEHADGVVTVDLTGVGADPAGPTDLAVQQLVFTVQGALQSTDPVRILVDGEPVERLWGVDTSVPVPRGDVYALRSLVQIDAPAHGARVGQDVRVSGEAAVFEATLLWEVLRDGVVVHSGSTSTAEGQRFAPYTFEVRLDPGEYTVRVLEDDPSGGEGRPVLSDDKTITVAPGAAM
jgi:hypothetical protein